MLTFKRKLILTKAQEQRINSWIGVCRVVYNLGLEVREAAWKNKQERIHKYELMKQVTDLRNSIYWVEDAPCDALQNAIERLDNSYNRFFRGAGFPKWANKRSYNSLTVKQNKYGTIKITDNRINFTKIGYLKLFKDSPVTGNIKTVTLIKETTGFFVCITTDATKQIQNQDENQVVGVDMGVANFYVDSNGQFVENPRHFKKYEAKLRIENRSLARKKKGSNSWKRQSKKLALLHHKISNVRKDFLHKESTKLAKANHTVYLEDLNVAGMSKNKNLSKHILDCGWGLFRVLTSYKTNVVAVNPKNTSRECNVCGYIDKNNRQSQSKFLCVKCGHEENADKNASKNIESRGTTLSRQRSSIEQALALEPTNTGMSAMSNELYNTQSK